MGGSGWYFCYFPKESMLVIQVVEPRDGGDEELRPVCVFSGISHRDQTGLVVAELRTEFILEEFGLLPVQLPVRCTPGTVITQNVLVLDSC